jgi:hypothetical protein
MNEKTQVEPGKDLSSESTEELITFGGVVEMTKGFQYGWKIEGRINPWYF